MSFKSIAVFINASSICESRILYAIQIAIEHNSHLIGIITIPNMPSSEFARGDQAIDEFIFRQKAREQTRVDEIEQRFTRVAEAHLVSFEVRKFNFIDRDQQAMWNSM